MYKAVTHRITICVRPSYLKAHSSPQDGRWVFSYTIDIENSSDETVRLRSRYWHITDGHGKVQEVRGPGVVGEEPLLTPGDSFTYTSGCPLPTPTGIMHGTFTMQRADGSSFDVVIPAFSLDAPCSRTPLN